MNVQYVIARYNEDIEWLLYTYKDIIIYNKGEKCLFHNQILLSNVGREAHTYLYHIVNNYDKLADITVFSQANIADHCGMNYIGFYDRLISGCRLHGISQNFYTISSKPGNGVDREFNFTAKNDLHMRYKVPMESIMKISYGEWFDRYIQKPFPTDWTRMYVGAIFAVSKEKIHSRSKEFYEKILKQLEHDNAPIEAHFLERSWYYLFD